ncbi:hypothetical protein T265_03897 [Opisthorchis viverrini]|uniref:Uncharacterized protein n=1 Tax=Opisthorchis viverrini TaxID=6198 RepID=A0A074ZQW6_OPIVI|nr:hypothetical protein T265_03897 [Opisthorchis viverrini]KER29526.1 hypothetical protein T265_03897 [Opisthorchis viverrini]
MPPEGKHDGWDTANLPKPRQGKSRGRSPVRTTDLPVSKLVLQPLSVIGRYPKSLYECSTLMDNTSSHSNTILLLTTTRLIMNVVKSLPPKRVTSTM